MKIFVPLHSNKKIKELIDVGASEFYAGLILDKWNENFRDFPINARGNNGKAANFSSYKEFAKAIRIASDYNKEVFLTLNSHCYTAKQIKFLYGIIKNFKNIGGNGIITSDLNLMPYIKELNLKIVVGSDAAIYNYMSAQFFVDNYNVNRIILPRDLNVNEIQSIKNKLNIEIEVFGQNGFCKFSNGICFAFHCKKMNSFCSSLDMSGWEYAKLNGRISFDQLYKIKENHFLYSQIYNNRACSLCAIYKFISLNIDSYKIVGREHEFGRIKKDVMLVANNINIAKKSENEQDYIIHMDNPYMTDPYKACKFGYQCCYNDYVRVINKNLLTM
ncbi:MAG: U32 family peptidase [Clostridiales bacterium]|jgi:collagenase-like PrtC family protease|nr:U32 family peptidase [Clostridiales bacterium]